MSKSLGNSPEPLKLIDKYGADAVRLSYVLPNPIDRDIIFDESTIVKSKQLFHRFMDIFAVFIHRKKLSQHGCSATTEAQNNNRLSFLFS